MKSIEIISIPVTDHERSKLFYQKLGFSLIVENELGKGQKWVQLGYKGDGASITLVTWFPNMPPGCISGFIIKTDDLEGDIAELAEKGVEFGKVDETPWGRFLNIKDPDGNTISLHQ